MFLNIFKQKIEWTRKKYIVLLNSKINSESERVKEREERQAESQRDTSRQKLFFVTAIMFK